MSIEESMIVWYDTFSAENHNGMIPNLLHQARAAAPPVQKEVVPLHRTISMFQCPKCKYSKTSSRSCLQHIKDKHQLILNPSEIKHFINTGLYKEIKPTEDVVYVESKSVDQIIKYKLNNSVVIDLSMDETEEEAIMKLISKCSAKEVQQYTKKPIKLFHKLNGHDCKATSKAISFIKVALRDALLARLNEQITKVKRLKQDLAKKNAGKSWENSMANRKRSRETFECNNDINTARAAAAKNLVDYNMANALQVKRSKVFSFPSK
jgi:hypothetical protein